ncbi:MAG: hypothetical protein KAH38_05065 [Candidatus Hydrogenedentes bacterium]|nr:hypothetical protein [Candidatus Hydrogenedentota bacterium]
MKRDAIVIRIALVVTFILSNSWADEISDAAKSIPSNTAFNVLADRLDSTENSVVDMGVNVRSFGATGNGIVNDSVSIQNAIDSLDGARGIVFFPVGTYYCANSIDAKRASLRGIGTPGVSGGGGSTISFTEQGSIAGIYSSIQDNAGYQIHDLKIMGNNKLPPAQPADTGQVLVDMTGQNFPRMSAVRIQNGGTGLLLANGSKVECHYGLFQGVDIGYCHTGIDIAHGARTWGAHSQTFVGGRIYSCTRSVFIKHTSNQIAFFGVQFEGKGIVSSGDNVTIVGCRMEGSGTNLLIREGAGLHFLFGNHWSSGKDIVDENKFSVVYGTDYAPDFAVATDFISQNLLSNGSFEYDLNNDGLADGWTVGYSSFGDGYSVALDTEEAQEGRYAQKIVNKGALNLCLVRYVTVEPDVPCVVRFRAKVTSGITRVMIGNGSSAADHTFRYIGVPAEPDWVEHRLPFTPSSDKINICIQLTGTDPRDIYVDGAVLTTGILAAGASLPQNVTEDGGVMFGQLTLNNDLQHGEGKIGLFGNNPVSQGAKISNSTGTPESNKHAINALLQYLRQRGDIESE